jgi:membrane protease YdiL (CAAX protease family)
MAGLSGAFRGRIGWAIAIIVVILALASAIDFRVAHASLVLGPCGAIVLLVVARWAGLSWGELGLGRGTWRRGLVWALGAIGAVAVVLAAGAALPATRSAFRDTRYHLDAGHALLTAFVLIPLGTVLFEEVAFRGVLWGLIRRGRATWIATGVSSALFGLWHVLSSLGLAKSDQAIGSTLGTGTTGQALSVLGTVLFTGLAGVVFCELRRRSGSLLASVGLHWATNGLAVLAAASIWAWGTRLPRAPARLRGRSAARAQPSAATIFRMAASSSGVKPAGCITACHP